MSIVVLSTGWMAFLSLNQYQTLNNKKNQSTERCTNYNHKNVITKINNKSTNSKI